MLSYLRSGGETIHNKFHKSSEGKQRYSDSKRTKRILTVIGLKPHNVSLL